MLSASVSRLGARTEFRIYPSIGIARVGDSTDGFIIGPEAPGIAPAGPFRGSDKGLKPQAARFRIYKVEIDSNENETVTEEIVPGGQTQVTWSVSLANRKAAGFLIRETLARVPNPDLRNKSRDRKKLVIAADGSVTGADKSGPVLAGSIEFAQPGTSDDIKLAALRTDDKGRLLVVGGPGESDSPTDARCDSFADNDDWYDSVSDGPVNATLRINGQDHPVVPAWVVITVPRYAPNNYGIITWFDQAVNMARTDADGRFNSPRSTSFTRDIYPILRRADDLSGLHGIAHSNPPLRALSDAARIASFSDPANRARVQQKLTKLGTEAPAAEQLPSGPINNMPRLFSGANPDPTEPTWTFLSLTRYQLAHVDNWVNGNFDMDWPGSPPAPVPLDQIPVARQAWALCEAALETCVGGAFFPGIEGTYDIARATTYHPQPNLRREFRVDPSHPAGFLTEKMALPWQADFADCADFWWPSQRPDDVVTQTGPKGRWDRGIRGTTQNPHLNMVDFWAKLGIVTRDPATGKFAEHERELPEPPVA